MRKVSHLFTLVNSTAPESKTLLAIPFGPVQSEVFRLERIRHRGWRHRTD